VSDTVPDQLSPDGDASTSPTVTSLAAIGFDARLEALFASTAPDGTLPARVARVDKGAATLLLDGSTSRAEISPDLRQALEYGDLEAMPAAGDWVAVRRRSDSALDLIEVILPRTSVFVRRAAEAGGESSQRMRPQVLAANVDIAFLVAAATDTRAGRLERIGVVAWESGAQPVVVLTKADLVSDPMPAIRTAEEALPGVPVLLVDSLSGDGIEPVRAYLDLAEPGAGRGTAVVLGASGVGKSTLVNALVGTEVLATGEVRESDGRGRHTTVARHLIPLPGGGALIDTPGIRAIATWGASDGIDLVFAEIEALAGECRFRDCAHEREPDCAVQAAVASGELEAKRLERYRGMQRERAHEQRRGDPQAQANRRDEARRLNRWLRNREDLKRKRGE